MRKGRNRKAVLKIGDNNRIIVHIKMDIRNLFFELIISK